jgi:hypothetical protein
MLFSCKISHSCLNYLDRRGEGLQLLEDFPDLPPLEFLKDPSYWLEAPRMEALLRFIQNTFGLADGPALLSDIGRMSKDLRSWGALDSVLRMVGSPKDLYSQPARLISYFVSPAPPIGNVIRQPEAVQFEVPIASSQYPLTVEYLRAAFESLPTYSGKPAATVDWNETQIAIHWSENQDSLLSEESDSKNNLHPELVQTIVADLERSQKQLEETNRLLHVQEKELQELRKQKTLPSETVAAVKLSKQPSLKVETTGLVAVPAQAAPLGDSAFNEVVQQVYRLGDYFARAQQLVTLLIAQDRNTPQVLEAMRRVDWTRIQDESRRVVTDTALQVKKLQSHLGRVE